MTYEDKNKLSSSPVAKSIMMTVLCGSLFCAIPLYAYSHPEKSDKDCATDGVTENIANSREEIRKMIQERREQAKERIDARRRKVDQRREQSRQEAALRRTETAKQQETFFKFKDDLIAMLKKDGVINTENDTINITYSDGHPVINDSDLSALYGDKYEALWREYDRVISPKSYIYIVPGSFVIREVESDGSSRHFAFQTGAGEISSTIK